MMTKAEVFQTLAAAKARVEDNNWPLDVRIRSKETVELCEERIRREGWTKPHA